MDNILVDNLETLAGLVNAFLPYKNETERMALVTNLNTTFSHVPEDLLGAAVSALRNSEERMPTEKRIREEVKKHAGRVIDQTGWKLLVGELARLRVDNCFEPKPWLDLAKRMDAAGMVASAAEVRARGNWLIDLAGVGK